MAKKGSDFEYMQPLTKPNLAALSQAEVEALFESWGEPKFRAAQLIRWIWKEGVWDLARMSNMSKSLRERLANETTILLPKIVHAANSSDGTIKYLMQMHDGKTVEVVWIPRDDQGRVTVCVSSQVGCKMGCTFCMTAQQKVERNLDAGEIAGQLLVLPNRDKITNVVLMGMGEPLDNYDNLIGALKLMTSPEALFIGPRRITVSTSGLVPAIRKFLLESKCRLAVSLNAPNDDIRSQIMPVNKAYNMDTLLGTLRELSSPKVRKPFMNQFRITFEYLLIRDLNDQVAHAEELAKRIRGIPCKINIMLYNENPNIPFKRPLDESVAAFRQVLSKKGILNFVRMSRGRDIAAACGQLVSEHKRKPLSGPHRAFTNPELATTSPAFL
jgi:23S rRNA (adenine2503-C2)-methyltransferase